jgi:16S rRNA (guanine527-N7)-methyltransferase
LGLLPCQSKIAYLGVGGGFPSMLLAIFLPEFEFYLVEAIRKKQLFCNMLRAV